MGLYSKKQYIIWNIQNILNTFISLFYAINTLKNQNHIWIWGTCSEDYLLFYSLHEIPLSKQFRPAFIQTAGGECQRFHSSHMQCQPITVQEQSQYSQSLCSAKVRDKSVKDIIGTICVGKNQQSSSNNMGKTQFCVKCVYWSNSEWVIANWISFLKKTVGCLCTSSSQYHQFSHLSPLYSKEKSRAHKIKTFWGKGDYCWYKACSQRPGWQRFKMSNAGNLAD